MTAGERDAAVDFIRALVNAWDCCGTCAGGVLAKRDRERDAALVAQAKRDAVAELLGAGVTETDFSEFFIDDDDDSAALGEQP